VGVAAAAAYARLKPVPVVRLPVTTGKKKKGNEMPTETTDGNLHLNASDKIKIVAAIAEWIHHKSVAENLGENYTVARRKADDKKETAKTLIRTIRGCDAGSWHEFANYEFDMEKVAKAICLGGNEATISSLADLIL
jgi:hypothetical protein